MPQLHSFERPFARIPGAKSDLGLCRGLSANLRQRGARQRMNPEQRTRSGFTARCCLSMGDVMIPAASGVSGDGETPPGLTASKQAHATEHLRIVSHAERPLRVFAQFAFHSPRHVPIECRFLRIARRDRRLV